MASVDSDSIYEHSTSSHDGSIDEDQDPGWEEVGLGFADFKLSTRFAKGRTIHENYNWESTVTEWVQIKKIGEGAFATVFLQEEIGKGRLRAVKRLNRMDTRNLERELGVLIHAQDHKSLFVEFLGWYEDERNHLTFLAMEYMQHGDLKQYIQSFPADSKVNVSTITKQLLQGLKVLHDQGIIHRDLKPQNVLVASVTPILVKLSDFGISRVLTEDKSMTITGTQAYMAPEMLGFLPPLFRPSKRYTFAVDIWALGCIVYELLTTKSPFKSSGYVTFDPSAPIDVVERPLLEDYCSGKSDFSFSWVLRPHASDEAIYFVKQLLVADPGSRMKIADALDLQWLLESPNNAFQRTEVAKRQFMSIVKQLKLDDDDKLLLAFKDSSDEDTITPVLLSLNKWYISILLYTASSKGYASIVQMLSQYMWRNSRELHSWPFACLQVAVACGHIEVVELLLGSYAVEINSVINSRYFDLTIPGFQLRNHLEALTTFLHFYNRNPVSDVFLFRRQYALQIQYALRIAGGNGVARFLIESCDVTVNVEPSADSGQTASPAVTKVEHVDMVKFLVSHSADIDAAVRDIKDDTVLQAVVLGGDVKLLELLLADPLHVSAYIGRLTKIRNFSGIVELVG